MGRKLLVVWAQFLLFRVWDVEGVIGLGILRGVVVRIRVLWCWFLRFRGLDGVGEGVFLRLGRVVMLVVEGVLVEFVWESHLPERVWLIL